MEDNETLTRRNNEDSSDSASIERESDKDYGIEEKFKPQVRDKYNKKHHGYDKNKTKRHKSKPKDEEKTGKLKALRERDERDEVKKELKDRCIDPPTRRNIDMPGNSTEFDGEDEDGYLEARIDNSDVNISQDLKDIVEAPAMRAHEENKNKLRSKIRRTECINENDKEREKCSKACNKAHTEVCNRRSCSRRARKSLKTECRKNCKKVFDSKVCDYN